MDIFLVGGAVRDALLKLPITERDWVVVGATGQQMLDLGYNQVGKDFPVFLHPITKEEYALARTERKIGPGYTGFNCYAAQDVTLEQDLQRRDLTINAMAQNQAGKIIDPYGGLQDLEQGILRHVSPAFTEDPLRVLRVARFAARYHYLGFKIAPETRALMYTMVKQGELNYLTPERVWQEWHKSLSEKNPEIFIQSLRDCGALKVLLPELDNLFGVPNPPFWHPEIDSGVHSLMALKQAVAVANCRKIRFASLVHDLGKARSPMQYWPSHHGHDYAGIELIQQLADRLKIPKEFSELAKLVAQYHILIHKVHELNATTIVKMLERLDAFRRPARFEQVLIACSCDAEGRGPGHQEAYDSHDFLKLILHQLQQISVAGLQEQGFSGQLIKQKLHQQRVYKVKQFLKSYTKL